MPPFTGYLPAKAGGDARVSAARRGRLVYFANSSFTTTMPGRGDVSGVIYDYLTGDYVGTFEGMAEGPPPGRRGKLAMAADAAGNVYVTNPQAGHFVSVFSTSAIPEPATCGLLGAGALAGLAAIRRRKP